MNNFVEKVNQLVVEQGRLTMMYMNPTVERMPLPIRRYDDPYLPFGKAVISATRDLVSGYVFDFANYLALGAAGAVALERTIAYAGREAISIIHGPFAHARYARLLDVASFNADAITLVNHTPADATTSSESYTVIDSEQQPRALYLPTASTQTLQLLDEVETKLVISGDDVLYADYSEDFTSIIRKTLKGFNDQYNL